MQRGAGARDPHHSSHPATLMLREILNLTERFEAHLGERLSVNHTDLEAMERLILSGPSTPTQLARHLGLTTAAATTVVDRLIAVGHVTREPHPTDRRAVLVVPNPRSVDRAMGTLLPMIRGIDGVIDDFSEEQRATITAYLSSVAAVYEELLAPQEVQEGGSA